MIEHFYQDIPGNFTFEDLYRFLATVGPRGVEIGVANGRSAAFLAVEMQSGFGAWERWHHGAHLTLIDNSAGNLAAALAACRRVEQHTSGFRAYGRLGDSCAEATHTENGSQDFVFIDGDHSYEACLRDIWAWLPKVRKGGYLAGHDFVEAEWSGVIRAVKESLDHVEVWRGSKWEDGNYYPSWLYRVPT